METIAKISVTKTNISRLPGTDFHQVGFGKVFCDHMLHAGYANGAWSQPGILPYQPISFEPSLMALHYGQAIFEGMKAYRTVNGEVVLFRPEANFERLNISAERMSMPAVPRDIFLDGLQQLVDLDRGWVPEQEGYSLYIRPFMFASDEFLGVRPSEKYEFYIINSPAGAYYNKPIRVKVETRYARAPKGGIGFAKAAGNYGGAMYPTQQAIKEGFDQVIWTDPVEHRYVEEAGTANLVFIINGEILTPPAKDTILKGTTLHCLLAIARDMGVPVQQREISLEEVEAAMQQGTLQEAFAVGTAATITQISDIGYKDRLYPLPEPEKWEISAAILKELHDIRYGKTEDKHGWLVKV